jgi:Family of unknown function (DUF5302)
MAETVSGPAGAEDGAAPQDRAAPGDGVAPGDAAAPEDESRRKFREALERKRAREAGAGATGQGKGAGKIHGAQGPARHRRSFRRKSG